MRNWEEYNKRHESQGMYRVAIENSLIAYTLRSGGKSTGTLSPIESFVSACPAFSYIKDLATTLKLLDGPLCPYQPVRECLRE